MKRKCFSTLIGKKLKSRAELKHQTRTKTLDQLKISFFNLIDVRGDTITNHEAMNRCSFSLNYKQSLGHGQLNCENIKTIRHTIITP